MIIKSLLLLKTGHSFPFRAFLEESDLLLVGKFGGLGFITQILKWDLMKVSFWGLFRTNFGNLIFLRIKKVLWLNSNWNKTLLNWNWVFKIEIDNWTYSAHFLLLHLRLTRCYKNEIMNLNLNCLFGLSGLHSKY